VRNKNVNIPRHGNPRQAGARIKITRRILFPRYLYTKQRPDPRRKKLDCGPFSPFFGYRRRCWKKYNRRPDVITVRRARGHSNWIYSSAKSVLPTEEHQLIVRVQNEVLRYGTYFRPSYRYALRVRRHMRTYRRTIIPLKWIRGISSHCSTYPHSSSPQNWFYNFKVKEIINKYDRSRVISG